MSSYSAADGDGSLIRHHGGVPAPSLLTRMEINRRGQRALVAAQDLLNGHALDTFEDDLYHQRVEKNMHHQSEEVETAVHLSRMTPEAEPYLRNIVVVANAHRVYKLSEG